MDTFPPDQVKPLRESLDLTQAEFASRLGVTRSLVTHWENKFRTPTGPAAILLSQMAAEKKVRKNRKTA